MENHERSNNKKRKEKCQSLHLQELLKTALFLYFIKKMISRYLLPF